MIIERAMAMGQTTGVKARAGTKDWNVGALAANSGKRATSSRSRPWGIVRFWAGNKKLNRKFYNIISLSGGESV